MKAVQPALAIRESNYLASEPIERIFGRRGRRCVNRSRRNRRGSRRPATTGSQERKRNQYREGAHVKDRNLA